MKLKNTFSVMFHHFHGDIHLPAQGSLDAQNFLEMIEWLHKSYSILGASDYVLKFKNQTLKEKEICLSFDDALKCQYDLAIPILEKLGIESFFFVYSSAFSESPDKLEIYRYFRNTSFASIDEFYKNFFSITKIIIADNYESEYSKFLNLNYLSSYPFYTENDKWFRYLRDQYLNLDQYHKIMEDLMIKTNFNLDLAKKNLWMTEEDIIDIDKKGHVIGLHSYSHPTQMSKLMKSAQEYEYKQNYKHLSKLINKKIETMAHPCGDYNNDTLKILNEMDINIGFRSNMSIDEIRSSLEIPREDHANIFQLMNR